MNEDALIAWFKGLFAQRTPAKSILDAQPQYRVYWTEIRAEMVRLGWPDDSVELRLAWDEIHKRHHLKAWCNHTMKVAGENLKI